MKNTNKNLFFNFIHLLLFLQFTANINGQEFASANWPLKSDITQIAINGNINAASPLINGLTSSTSSTYLMVHDTNTSEFDENKYIQFEVEPLPGYIFDVDDLTVDIYCVQSTTAYVKLCVSLVPDFTEYITKVPQFRVLSSRDYITFPIDMKVPEGKTLYIRLYPYGRNSYNNDYDIKLTDLSITGFTTQNTSINYEKEAWCNSETIAEVTLNGPENGTFSSSEGLIIDGSTGSIDVTNSQPGTYTVNYTYSGELIATTIVTILPTPDCIITGPDGPLNLSTTYTFTAPEGMAGYDWSVTGNAVFTSDINSQAVTVETDASGSNFLSLTLTVEDANGCTGTCSKSNEINVPDPGSLPTAILSGTQSICMGNSADLVVNLTGEPPWSFTWTDGLEEHLVETPENQYIIKVYPAENTTYSLTGLVTDGNGYTNAATGEAIIYFGPVTTAPEIIACPNTTVELPITVKSFREVRDISLALKYNPGVMTFLGFENGDIAFGEGNIGEILVNDNTNEDGIIIISKSSEDVLPDLADDAVLLRLKFNYTGGNTNLEWIDSPDDSWCSYSFLSAQDETGFETEAFCDIPAEAFYINGSVRQLNVTGTDVEPVADISTITGTPVIIPVTVSYPDLIAQEVSPVVLTDARISYNGTGSFPAGARIFEVTYNGNSVLSSPFAIGEKSEVLLSEILRTVPNPLLGHSTQTVDWKIFVDGINSDAVVPVKVDAIAYTELTGCDIVLDSEPFNIAFAGATLALTESIEVCGKESLQLTAEIGYPVISNLHADIKADTKISTVSAFPQGTTITWNYNNSSIGSYTLNSGTNEIMLSTIVGSLPSPLQGHSGTDVWMFEISNAGLMTGNEVTIEAVALLDGVQYVHSTEHISMTVNPVPAVTAVSLLTSTDESNWTAVAGELSTGYNMCVDPAEEYHYLDIDELLSSVPLNSYFEMNAFFLDINLVPDGFYEYWSSKGVNASSTDGWQAVMWDIISGTEPMFYINYDGTDYKLTDGLKYRNENIISSLRITGDYPAGSYTFNGTVTDVNSCITDEIAVILDLSSSPVITCPEDISVNSEAGICGASVSFAGTAAGTPAPEIGYTLADGTLIESGHFFPVGNTEVTAIAVNDCKTVNCTFNVTVTDNEAPDISCRVSENVDVAVTNGNTYIQSGTSWDALALDNCSVITEFIYTMEGATTGTGESLHGTSFNMGTTEVTWQATDAAGNTAECSYTVTVSGVNLTGTVNYYNKTETPLDNVSVTLLEPETKVVVSTTATNANGEYAFIDLGQGIYNIAIDTDKEVRSINSTDAGQVNAWNVAQSEGAWPQIEKVRFLAGDVNEDTYLGSPDAGIIQQYFLTLGTEETFVKSWEFWKTQVPINIQPQTENMLQIEIPAGSSGVTQNFYGLVSGDFNRSNIPESGIINSLFVKSANAVESSVSLLSGDTLFADTDDVIEIPICALSTMQVGAISLILDFPAEQIQVLDVYLKDDSSQPAGFNVLDDKLVIGWNSVNPVSVYAGEPMVTVKIKVIEEPEMPFFFRLANNPLNELADENMIAIENPSLTMDGLMMKESITGINIPEYPESFRITCWPNPFDEHFTIRYLLPADGQVNLHITDVAGNNISILHNRQQSAGEYMTDFDGTHLLPGVYTITLRLKHKKGRLQMTTDLIIKK